MSVALVVRAPRSQSLQLIATSAAASLGKLAGHELIVGALVYRSIGWPLWCHQLAR